MSTHTKETMLQSTQDTYIVDPTSVCSEAPANAREKTANTDIWESLMAKLRAQLRVMPMDECYARALELQIMARSEVDCRSPHASDSMPITAIGQPALKRTGTPVAFVPISPMKSSRKSQTTATPPCYHDRYPSYQQMYPPPPSGKDLLPPSYLPYPWPIHMTQSSFSQFCIEGAASMPHDMLPVLNNGNSKEAGMVIHGQYLARNKYEDSCVLHQNPDTSMQLDMVGTHQPTSGSDLQGDSIRVASKWSEIRSTATPRQQTKRKAKKKVRGTKKSKVSGAGKKKNGHAGLGMAATLLTLDVLGGRGGTTNRHAGNFRFRDEARKLRGVYQDTNTSKEKKFLLAKKLVNRVHEYGGRFLKKGKDGLWHKMCAEDARKKCSQALRENKWN